MTPEIKSCYEFGPYRLDPAKRLLLKDGKSLPLQPKTFDLLLLLVESHGRVLTRGELLRALWSESFVEEANLSFQVSLLRRTLGDQGAECIETVPKHGYRFHGAVSEVGYEFVADETLGTIANEGHSRDSDPKPERAAIAHHPPAQTSGFPRLGLLPLLALVSLLPWMVQLRKDSPHERTVRFAIAPSEGMLIQDRVLPAMSPDGQRLVFVGLTPGGGQRLWMRALDSLRTEPLSGTEMARAAFWSPDSKTIAFFAGGKLKTIEPHGAPSAQILCDATGGTSTGSWSRNGTILFQTRAHPQLYKVSSRGGVPQPATVLDPSRQEVAHYAPQFLPDGRHFIYFVQSARPENTGIYVGDLDSNRSTFLVNSNTNAAYAENSGAAYLLFTKGTALVGQSFDPNTRQLAGTPFPVAEQLQVNTASGLTLAAFSASANGVLVYRTGADSGSKELVWFDRHGNRLGRVGAPDDYSNPALSPDEKKLAVALTDSSAATRDLWIFDLTQGTSSRLTFDPGDETNPVWSPDGARLAFTAVRNGRPWIYQTSITGMSSPKPFVDSGHSMTIADWSRDGRRLLYRTNEGTWLRSLTDDPASERLLGQGTGKLSTNAEVSPDGHWVAYQLNEANRSEVYVESLTLNGGKRQVSSGGGMEPHWRRDGKELFYVAGQKLVAVEVRAEGGVFQTDSPKALFEVRLENFLRRSRYQVAANGQKFLVNVPLEPQSPFTVAINWTPGGKP